MRILPCFTCRQPALSTRSPERLHAMGTVHDSLTRYLCARCGHPQLLTAAEFVRLPMATPAEIAAAGITVPAHEQAPPISPSDPTDPTK